MTTVVGIGDDFAPAVQLGPTASPKLPECFKDEFAAGGVGYIGTT